MVIKWSVITVLTLLVIIDVGRILSSPSTITFRGGAVGREGEADQFSILPCPDDQDFCEDPEDFPSVSTRYGHFTITNGLNLTSNQQSDDGLSLRSGGNHPEQTRACEVSRSKIFPRKARDLSGAFRFVLNSEEYVQSLDVEKCVGDGLPCVVDDDAPGSGSTYCRQQYSVYQLISLDENGQDVVNSYRMPSACICHHTTTASGRGGSGGFSFLEARSSIGDGERDNMEVEEMEEENVDVKRRLPLCEVSGQIENNQNQDRSTSGDDSRVFFSDDESSRPTTVRRLHPAILQRLRSSGCEGEQAFCETSASYPEELIESFVDTRQTFPSRIKQKLLKETCVHDASTDIQTRFNINEDQLCQGIKRIIIPKEALNLRKEWRYIINSHNYTQSVNIEECAGPADKESRNEDTEYGSCMYSGLKGNNPEGTVCKQLYREHRLMIISDSGELEIDSFSLPSACACHLRPSFASLNLRRAT